MSVKFILVTHPQDTAWPLALGKALAPLGTLETVPRRNAAAIITQYHREAIVIIDASVVKNVPALISRLRRQCPKSRIVVATACPTWQHAREAFQAGAVDYIRKSWDCAELLAAIKGILGRQPVPSS